MNLTFEDLITALYKADYKDVEIRPYQPWEDVFRFRVGPDLFFLAGYPAG